MEEQKSGMRNRASGRETQGKEGRNTRKADQTGRVEEMVLRKRSRERTMHR